MSAWWGEDYTRRELLLRVGTLDQVAGVRLVTLGDGVGRGVRVLEFRTGSGFAFEVLVDRAFDLGHAEHAGRPISWRGAVGVQGPWYAEPQGLGFLRSFGGGLLTTCGLDHTLFPTDDSAEGYGYPPKHTEHYGLHGRISTRPARLLAYGECWEGDECVLYAEGEVMQASALGEHLVLRRRIEARVGESRLVLHDEVRNAGFHSTPHMLLYHVTFGFPVVDEGAQLLIPAGEVRALGEAPLPGWTDLTAPEAGATERVYEYEPLAEADGRVPVGVVNPARAFGAYPVFHRSQLPHPFVWRNLGEGEYMVALEPSTNRVAGRHDARERGELIHLAPGEVRRYSLELGALGGTADIGAFAGRVAALRETVGYA